MPMFLQQEVAKATGVPDKTISNLIDRGLFTPRRAAPGKGQRRRFSAADVARLLTLWRLAEFIGYDEAHKATLYIEHRIDGRQPLSRHLYLCIEPKDAIMAHRARFAAQHESKKYDMYTVDTPRRTPEGQQAILSFPVGRVVHAAWDRLMSPYEPQKAQTKREDARDEVRRGLRAQNVGSGNRD